MTTKVMHGRREGQSKENERMSVNGQEVGFAAQGIDPRSVLVVQPNDWQRIQDNLSRYNREAEEAKLRREERERHHEASKNMVKSWDNTNEGIRQKKLQARNLKEQKEEEERVQIDIEEAALQAQKRKEAIERAKTLQYNQTDRVKEFHGALLLTEVMKERDAQVELKNMKKNWEKEKDQYLYQLQQRQIEESIKCEQEKALERYQKKRETARFQLGQVSENIAVKEAVNAEDKKERQEIKQQVEMYEAAKAVILKQRRADKEALKETYKKDQERKKIHQQNEQENELKEDIEIGKFVNAKKKMIKMRKEKEYELFQEFQSHTERMRQRLHEQMKHKVDDEDDRIAKAVAEREKKRLDEERIKNEEKTKELDSIKDHRIQMIQIAETLKGEEKLRDEEDLKSRLAEDNKHKKENEEKRKNRREKSRRNQSTLTEQMHLKTSKKEAAHGEQLEYDKRNLELIIKEEEHFQEYAKQVISEAESRGRNPFPLKKVAASGPGGGNGPKFNGVGGLRPSYPASDSTAKQLPYYRKDGPTHDKTYGHVGRSGKRLGFTW